jgi:hypothetical protein
VTPSADDERVRELLGRTPRGAYRVVVRDESGDPVVLLNEPVLDDGTPMPTRYWLVGAKETRRIGTLESTGGVAAAEAAVDPGELAAAHRRYADERDAALSPDHDGPRPTGGVGGTRLGVKCLHAHWAWHLAGGDDPVGRWIEQQLTGGANPAPHACEIVVSADATVVHHGDFLHEIPWGHVNLTERWLRDGDPPRPDALTNALGTVADHLDDVLRLDPEITEAKTWTFMGPTITSLASLEAGFAVPSGPIDYPRAVAEEVFRLVATDAERHRADNPGLPLHHVEYIVATSCIVQACMRHLHLETVTLRASTGG